MEWKETGEGRPVHNRRVVDRRSFLRLAGGVIAVSAAPGVLVACSTEEQQGGELVGGQVDTSRFQKEPPWKVGRAGAGDVNDWMTFLSVHYDHSINLKHGELFGEYIVTDAQFDPSKQIADIEDLLTQDIDILFTEPTSTSALIGPLRQAVAAGIPIVLVSTRVDSEEFTSLISRNNYRDGQLKAQWMAEKLGDSGKFVALMGVAGSSYATDVWRGVQDVLANHPDIELLGMQNANWSVPDAKAATEAFLVKHDEIDAVLSDGGQMGLGALAAFKEAGRPLPPITADDWNGWLRVASEEEVEFFAVSGSANLSVTGVDIGVSILQGEPVPKLNDAPFVTFEQDELDEWFRPDLVDAYWGHHSLPEDFVTERFSL